MATIAPLTSYTYAAGTCALRLTGQVSPLSALAERPVLKRSRFQIQIWEEPDLEESTSPTANPVNPDPDPVFDLSGREPDLADLTHLVQRYVQTYLQGATITPPQGLSQGTITLAPVGLTRHRLTITGEDNPQPAAVNLSLLQLADLAEVLTQADQAVEHLPEALVPSVGRRSRPRLPLWMGSVAAVLVAAVLGSQWLTNPPASMVQSPSPTTETASPPADRSVSEEDLPQDPGGGAALDSAINGAEAAPGTPSSASAPAPESSVATDAAPTGGDRVPFSGTPTLPPPASPAGATPKIPENPRPSPPSRGGNSRPQAQPTPPPNAPISPNAPMATVPAAPAATPPTTLEASPEASPEPAASQGAAASPADAMTPAHADPTPSTPSNRVGIAAAESQATEPLPSDWLETLRTALQGQWTPIPGMVTPLRYRLTLGAMGEVLTLEPLTAPSRQYLERGTLPQVGDVLPNLRRSQPATVEVQLLPSGDVLILPIDPEAP